MNIGRRAGFLLWLPWARPLAWLISGVFPTPPVKMVEALLFLSILLLYFFLPSPWLLENSCWEEGARTAPLRH